MWIMLLLLWTLPLSIAVIAAIRSAEGTPLLKANERKLLFDETKPTKLSPWMVIKFVGICVVFLLGGLLQGLLLPNMNIVLFVLVPLLTGGAAILALTVWIRSAPRGRRIRRISLIRTRLSHIGDTFFG
jgi:hypothetical protein